MRKIYFVVPDNHICLVKVVLVLKLALFLFGLYSAAAFAKITVHHLTGQN